jgi:hypothetical protein
MQDIVRIVLLLQLLQTNEGLRTEGSPHTLDRLGRNVPDIVNILHNLEQLGIGFQRRVTQHRVFTCACGRVQTSRLRG